MLDLRAIGIDVVEGESSIAFILPPGVKISSATYKAITVSGDACYYLPCARSVFNGRNKVTYFLDGYRSLRSYAAGGRSVTRQLKSVVRAACTAGENGNLSVRCTVFDMDRVFVGEEDGTVGLLYIPVDPSSFDISETQARQAVFTLCKDVLAFELGSQSPLRGASDTPEYSSGDLGCLLNWIDSAEDSLLAPEGATKLAGAMPVYELSSKTPGLKARFRIEADKVVIGRLPEMAEFAIPASPTVSARHCSVQRMPDGSLCVMDLGSTNGTFVNGNELRAGELVSLYEGSILGLGASVELLVTRSG